MLNLAIVLCALFSLLTSHRQSSFYALLACLLLVALLWFSQQAWWLLGFHLLIMVLGCGLVLRRGLQ